MSIVLVSDQIGLHNNADIYCIEIGINYGAIADKPPKSQIAFYQGREAI